MVKFPKKEFTHAVKITMMVGKLVHSFLPHNKGCLCIDFTHGVLMSGQAGGWVARKSLSGLYLRKHKV